jgi:hypothetical protein
MVKKIKIMIFLGGNSENHPSVFRGKSARKTRGVLGCQ